MAEVEWKRNIIKTIIYRIITLILGTITVFLATGDLAVAGIVALITEAVQSVNYFIFETIWDTYEKRRLREKFEKELINREVDIKIKYLFLKDLSYELSQMDTFIADVYNSILDFYNRMLKNEQLKDIHEDILKHREHFIKVHARRNFPEREELEVIKDLLEEKDLEKKIEEKEGEEKQDEEKLKKADIEEKDKNKENKEEEDLTPGAIE
ncbi:MAG: DUF2061 domain-containing protein [Promethearchaeia archaeon]